MTHPGVPHLVYVRRKPEASTPRVKNEAPQKTQGGLNAQAPLVLDPPKEPTPTAKAPPPAPTPSAKAPPPAPTPSAKAPPNLPTPSAKAPPNLPTPSAKAPSNLPTPSAKAPPNLPSPATVKAKQWEARVFQFNNLLNKLDQSDQKDYIQVLRSLSSIELSKQAVDLENRAIQLSIDEAKEIQRVQILDVLERYS